MTVTVRSFRPGDIDGLARIIAAAYGSPLSTATRAQLAAAPDDILMAELGGRLAGVVVLANYGELGYVGSMGVDPAVRRRGVARALMEELTRRCARAGVTGLALDATEAGAPLYEQFGFSQTDSTHVYERGAPHAFDRAGAPHPAPQAIEAAVALDRELIGWKRDGVLRAFLGDGGARLVLESDGYAFVRGSVIGPWVAASDTCAERLLDVSLAEERGPLRAFVPGCNARAATLLERRGFARARSLRHMTRGQPLPRRSLIYGQASLAHG